MKKTILAIDDDKFIQKILKESLLLKADSATGNEDEDEDEYEIIFMNDGEEAHKWLEENLPDLVICDIQMQPMDGYGFLNKFREQDETKPNYTKNTPVIMLSVMDTSADRVKCYHAKAQDYLKKPFNPMELKALIKKNLHPIHYKLTRGSLSI